MVNGYMLYMIFLLKLSLEGTVENSLLSETVKPWQCGMATCNKQAHTFYVERYASL
jgi:hypothetical protein